MMQMVVLITATAFMGFVVWKFFVAEWTSSPWRTRRSGPSNNWQNEGFMAHQDGKSWQEIDAASSTDVPPRRPSGNSNRF
jgi:hypothetical protein